MPSPPIPPPPAVSFWWEPFELGSLTDLASIVLSIVVLAFTAWVARRQLRLMDDQDAVIREQVRLIAEQTASSRRIEETSNQQKILLERQAEMIRRQGEIAEAQQALMAQQLAKRAKLILETPYLKPPPGTSLGRTSYALRIRNKGDKTCRELYLSVLVPKNRVNELTLADDASHIDSYAIVDSQYYEHFSIHFDQAIFPERAFSVGTVNVRKVDRDKMAPVPLLWAVVSEDGRDPEEHHEFNVIHLQQEAWQPGEKPGEPV